MWWCGTFSTNCVTVTGGQIHNSSISSTRLRLRPRGRNRGLWNQCRGVGICCKRHELWWGERCWINRICHHSLLWAWHICSRIWLLHWWQTPLWTVVTTIPRFDYTTACTVVGSCGWRSQGHDHCLGHHWTSCGVWLLYNHRYRNFHSNILQKETKHNSVYPKCKQNWIKKDKEGLFMGINYLKTHENKNWLSVINISYVHQT